MSSAQTDEGGASEAPNVEPGQMKRGVDEASRSTTRAASSITPGPGTGYRPGRGPRRHGSFASFSGPDGNGWLLQEVQARAPGR